MKLKLITAAAAFALAAAMTPAAASPTFETDGGLTWGGSTRDASSDYSGSKRSRNKADRYSRNYSSNYAGGLGPRPRRWCGWWMRSQRGGGPELNVAWNWSKWGRPTVPQIGAVVVWRHHVGEIVGKAPNGMWLVRSGNDGNAVRTRARSVAGAVFRI